MLVYFMATQNLVLKTYINTKFVGITIVEIYGAKVLVSTFSKAIPSG